MVQELVLFPLLHLLLASPLEGFEGRQVHNLSGQLERAHAFINTIRKGDVTEGVNE